jgi:hypothetical protein
MATRYAVYTSRYTGRGREISTVLGMFTILDEAMALARDYCGVDPCVSPPSPTSPKCAVLFEGLCRHSHDAIVTIELISNANRSS